jgi:hypothetical protein
VLTNCHTLILRNLLDHGPEPPPGEQDLYLYNVAPDHLPLAEGFRSRETHRFDPPSGALERYPKLIWVKCHLVVDNFCHYGPGGKPAGGLSPAEKEGYTYRRGAGIVPLMIEYAAGMGAPLNEADAHYLAHTMVEIAVDYIISAEDRSVPGTLRRARTAIAPGLMAEFEEGIAALYGRTREEITATRDAAERFYGDVDDIDFLYLDGRTRIILRKLRLPFTDENVARTRRLILDSAARIPDAMDFVRDSVEMLADRGAWAGGGAMVGETE